MNDYNSPLLDAKVQTTAHSYPNFLVGNFGGAAYVEDRSSIFRCPSIRTPSQQESWKTGNWRVAVYSIVTLGYQAPASSRYVVEGKYKHGHGGDCNMHAINPTISNPSEMPFFLDSRLDTPQDRMLHYITMRSTTRGYAWMIHADRANIAFYDGHIESAGEDRYRTVTRNPQVIEEHRLASVAVDQYFDSEGTLVSFD